MWEWAGGIESEFNIAGLKKDRWAMKVECNEPRGRLEQG